VPTNTEIFITHSVKAYLDGERKKDKRWRFFIILFLIINLIILGIEAYNFYAWKERTEQNQKVFEQSMEQWRSE
jgi:flagellar basal body-associated protein FliL